MNGKFSSSLKNNKFKISKWIHLESEIEFTRKDYLRSSGKEGRYEYSYILLGFSPFVFQEIKEINFQYQHEDFTKDRVIHYFNLLEKQNLIKKIKLKELLYLDKEIEIYTFFDNSLRELLADCSTLQSYIHIHTLNISGNLLVKRHTKKEHGLNIIGEKREVRNGLLNVIIKEENIKRKIIIIY